MRIVALEEHFAIPEMIGTIDRAAIAARGWPGPGQLPPSLAIGPTLHDVGQGRLAAMDEAGVTTQVLSAAGPGADLLSPAEGIVFAKTYNDRLAAIVADRGDRFAGFAHLPMTAPEAAADELERAISDLGFCGALINGTTQGRFLDDPAYALLLARAEKLDVPIYVHPNVPPPAVREAYYSGLPGGAGHVLAMAGWGWHSETAIHVLRLALSGALDRHPGLKLIIGHMGEGLAAMMDRFDHCFNDLTASYLQRPISQAIRDQLWVTTSGMYAMAPFLAALTAFGADRLLFSIDYPFASSRAQTDFLKTLALPEADRRKIAHANADALLRLNASATA